MSCEFLSYYKDKTEAGNYGDPANEIHGNSERL